MCLYRRCGTNANEKLLSSRSSVPTAGFRLCPRYLPPVNRLKHLLCVKETRRAVLDALEFTYERPIAGVWAFVAVAEKEHPEPGLLTPPTRPAKK
jgi:hypothetical protein